MMEDKINIAGLDKVEVLRALYQHAKSQGMGLLHFDPAPMSRKESEALLQEGTYFDYLQGRVMKVDLGSDELWSRLYDRDNGEGAAARALQPLLDARDATGVA